MSFSSEVKEELSGQMDSARHCRIAFLTALFHMAPVLTEDSIGIRTDHAGTAQAFENVLKKVVSAPVSTLRRPKGKSFEVTVTVSGKDQVKSLLEAMKYDRAGDPASLQDTDIRAILPSRLLLQKTCCRRAYLRGVFLMTGSMSDPAKSYHLEIVFQREEDAGMIVSLMDSLGFGAKVSRRKERFVVYLKDSEQISDLLGAMGATGSLMKLENERILKDIAGNINRQVNFDAANLGRTGVASQRQREDIELLEKTIGLKALPSSLRQAAQLRLSLPDASLKELSEASQPHVGKSGINHRLKKLQDMAAQIRLESGMDPAAPSDEEQRNEMNGGDS